ncbi:MAG: hypothetical protein R2712_27505 [Vicinamibacterales bacterium]
MVWFLASTTVKGQTSDDVMLVRRPPAPDVTGPRPEVKTSDLTPAAPGRPVTDDSSLFLL